MQDQSAEEKEYVEGKYEYETESEIFERLQRLRNEDDGNNDNEFYDYG
jgi:hypothetical protein